MKKHAKKLQLHRETVHHLNAEALSQANGAIMWTGCVSGCTACPGDAGYTRPVFEGNDGVMY